jgi:GNAT superfamily N-acetyltransferase
VQAAYSLEYETDYGLYYSAADITLRREELKVEGAIFLGDVGVGEFVRTLRFRNNHGQAFHDFFEVQPEHRGRGLATQHYTTALRFYDRTRIRRIDLEAAADGPWIWPQLGFDLVSRNHKQRLRRIATEMGFTSVPSVEELYAANVATADPRGIEALKELARLENCRLRMFLDLDDQSHRTFLVARGILSAGRRAV